MRPSRSGRLPVTLIVMGLLLSLPAACSSSDSKSSATTTTPLATIVPSGPPEVIDLGYGYGFNYTPDVAARRVHASTDWVWAGKVQFTVRNPSETMAHELDVLKTDSPYTELVLVPFSEPPPPAGRQVGVNPNKCKGSFGPPVEWPCGVTRVGGVPPLPPRALPGTFTLDLKPGKYVLVCNLPGHYEMGEATPLTVKPLP